MHGTPGPDAQRRAQAEAMGAYPVTCPTRYTAYKAESRMPVSRRWVERTHRPAADTRPVFLCSALALRMDNLIQKMNEAW